MEKLWERFFASLEDKNAVSGLQRLVNNAETMSAYFEANGILTEARHALFSLKTHNKKINLSTYNRDIDNVLVFVFLKSITTIPSQTKAYRLGLIDRNGKLIKDPKTQEEHNAISNLDLLMFKLREWLRPKMYCLSSVNWIRGLYKDKRIQNYLLNSEIVSKQYVVRQLNSELDTILRKH
jgi:hypothetical protein